MADSAESFRHARADMVRDQLETRGIEDPAVLRAMATVPREAFVPGVLRAKAYTDHPLQIGCGQTISQPYMVAVMTELLHVHGDARVLEIGTGSGYQTAVLAELAAAVVSIERHEALADTARARLEALGYANIEVVCGDGSLGWPEAAPFDRILVTAGAPDVPTALEKQLAHGGRIVCPTGPREAQKLVVADRDETGITRADGLRCLFVPLIGADAWTGNEPNRSQETED